MGDTFFTGRELDVMAVLWARGPSTVSEVRDALRDELAYTTVLTVLRTLETKGHVAHEAEGKAHRYSPLVAREQAGRSAVGHLVEKIFGGSREMLLAHLVEGRGVSDEEVKRLRRVLNDRLRRSGGEP
jgi:BlaI family transcriptional regulator, penicillinase repressor